MEMDPSSRSLEERPSGIAALDQRSREIFTRLVETYLQTGEPVGSRTISRVLPGVLSPASVRNVMADLEEAGLIFSPHTRAGRMPTELGLRFYVDALLQGHPLEVEERAKIEARVAQANRARSVEEILTETSNVLSGLSHCAGVVVVPKINVRLRHIEFVNLAPGRALVVLVNEDGSVENRAIDVPVGLPASALNRASNFQT
jgi:heat-inducible transcriptional repressor